MQLCLGLEEFVVFDFETTGLSPMGGDEVIEIGAVKIFGAEIDEVNYYHTLVNPNRLIPEDATRVHGITNEMVQSAPSIDLVLPKFLEFVGEAHLVAQNAKFDMGFLMKYLVKYSMTRPLDVHDTIFYSRRCFPSENSHNLDRIAERLMITYDSKERHRSMADVLITAKAFVLLRERLGENVPSPERWGN